MAWPWLAARARSAPGVVSAGQLAADSQVATPAGPRRVRELQPGMEVWAVTAAGETRPARVRTAESVSTPVPLVRILTGRGEILAPEAAHLAGAQGPVAASEIRPGPRSLELLAPADLPGATTTPAPLEGLTGLVAVVPEEIADLRGIKSALARANVQYTVTSRGGWVAVQLGCCEKKPATWTWSDELNVLLSLTAWAPEDGNPVYRTRIDDRIIHARLVGALLACSRNFEVRWVPAYHPVEGRVTLLDSTPPPFVGVVASYELNADAVEVVVEGATAVVADFAYFRLRRLED